MTIDEVRIYTGNNFDEDTFNEFAPRQEARDQGPDRRADLHRRRPARAAGVDLQPAARGRAVHLEVLDQFPAEDPDSPVCVTDVVFYSDGKPLNGAWLTQKLKYDKQPRRVMGTWFAGYDGAPDRFLSFFFDGTFRYIYEPFDTRSEAAQGRSPATST